MPPTTQPEPLSRVMKRAMAEEHGMSFRLLAERTRDLDARGRGLTHSYLSRVARRLENPTPESIELILEALEINPGDVLEWRLAQVRKLLDPRDAPFGVGVEAAARHLLAVEPVLTPELEAQEAPEGGRHGAAGPAVPGPPAGGALEQLLQGAETKRPGRGRSPTPGRDPRRKSA